MKPIRDIWPIIGVAIAFTLYIGVFCKYLWDMDHKTIRYNCDIAEISPDVPLEVREQCRKLRSGRI